VEQNIHIRRLEKGPVAGGISTSDREAKQAQRNISAPPSSDRFNSHCFLVVAFFVSAISLVVNLFLHRNKARFLYKKGGGDLHSYTQTNHRTGMVRFSPRLEASSFFLSKDEPQKV